MESNLTKQIHIKSNKITYKRILYLKHWKKKQERLNLIFTAVIIRKSQNQIIMCVCRWHSHIVRHMGSKTIMTACISKHLSYGMCSDFPTAIARGGKTELPWCVNRRANIDVFFPRRANMMLGWKNAHVFRIIQLHSITIFDWIELESPSCSDYEATLNTFKTWAIGTF